MKRYILILVLVLALPQMVSAESVNFGATLNPDGGHAGGSASGNGTLTGSIHWAGNGIDVQSGWVIGFNVWLTGTVSRSNDPALLGQTVNVYANSEANFVQLSVPGLGLSYNGVGHVTIR